MAMDVARVRREWQEGYARLLEEARDPVNAERLYAQVEVVTAQLRRRVGAVFELVELADAYAGSDTWVREAVAEHAAAPGWPRALATVGDAAFHLYSRGAVDYVP
jgi:hypothetical protein